MYPVFPYLLGVFFENRCQVSFISSNILTIYKLEEKAKGEKSLKINQSLVSYKNFSKLPHLLYKCSTK